MLALFAAGLSTALLGQQPAGSSGLTQENVLRQALAQFPDMDAVTFNGVFAPGATSGRHRHPGTEVLHVISGRGVVIQDGRDPVEVTPGMTLVLEPEAGGTFIHEVRNLSDTEVLRTYIVLLVSKDQPPFLPL